MFLLNVCVTKASKYEKDEEPFFFIMKQQYTHETTLNL